jgi:serine/threonine-protein kinase
MSQEAVPPSHLYTAVPRDLETICLKCLNKEPSRRYGTAAELAADLLRFQRGEPILARPAGPIERLVKWTRRHRSLSAFIMSGFLLLTALLTGVTWMLVERAVVAREVEDDFKQVVKAQTDQKWGEARTALERAKARLGSGGPSVLVRRAAQLDRELKLVGTLEEIFFFPPGHEFA